MQTPKATTVRKTVNTPITQYFKINKVLPNKNIEKKTRPRKTKNGTKPIESYFAKGKSNTGLGVVALPQTLNSNINSDKQNITSKLSNLELPEFNSTRTEQVALDTLENDNNSLSQINSTIGNNKFNFKNKITQRETNYTPKTKGTNNKLNMFDKFEQSLKKVQECCSSTSTYNKEQINQEINKDFSYTVDVEPFDNYMEEVYIDKNYTNPSAGFLKNIQLNRIDEISNLDSTTQNNKNDTINFHDFSFFESYSQKNKDDAHYDTDFYPSNLSDLFRNQSQNFSQFSLMNNNDHCKKMSYINNEDREMQPTKLTNIRHISEDKVNILGTINFYIVHSFNHLNNL